MSKRVIAQGIEFELEEHECGVRVTAQDISAIAPHGEGGKVPTQRILRTIRMIRRRIG